MTESKNFLTKKISEMNSLTLYFIIKTCSMNSDQLNKRKSKKKRPRKVLRLELKKNKNYRSKCKIWTLKVTNLNMVKIPQCSTKCIWTTFRIWIVTLFQIMHLLNLSPPRSLRDHIVSKVLNTVFILQMIDKMMRLKVKVLVCKVNLFQKVIKQWSIFLHVNSQNLLTTWEDSTVSNSSMKGLKSSNKTGAFSMEMVVNRPSYKCLAICNLLMPNHKMVSSISAQRISLYKICSVEYVLL